MICSHRAGSIVVSWDIGGSVLDVDAAVDSISLALLDGAFTVTIAGQTYTATNVLMVDGEEVVAVQVTFYPLLQFYNFYNTISFVN